MRFVLFSVVTLSLVMPRFSWATNIPECQKSMGIVARVNSYETFAKTFADFSPYLLPQSTRNYEQELLDADSANLFKLRSRDAEAALNIHRFIGPAAQRAFLIKDAEGHQTVVIGTVNIKSKSVSKKFLIEYRNPVALPGNRVFGNLFTPGNREGALNYSYEPLEAKVPVAYEITQLDGQKAEVPMDRVVAVSGDLRDRRGLFASLFTPGDKNGYSEGTRVMNLIYAQNWREVIPAVQDSITELRTNLEQYALNNEPVAYLLRQRDGNQVFGTGIIRPILGHVRGYQGIIGVEITPHKGQGFKVAIADTPEGVGLIRISDKPFSNYTALTAQELDEKFSVPQLHDSTPQS